MVLSNCLIGLPWSDPYLTNVKDEINTMIAVMSDVEIGLGMPCFNINNIKSLTDFIEETYITSGCIS